MTAANRSRRVERPHIQRVDALLSAGRRGHCVAVLLEDGLERTDNQRIVVNEQDTEPRDGCTYGRDNLWQGRCGPRATALKLKPTVVPLRRGTYSPLRASAFCRCATP